ncbi:MAG: type II toxin-antitoxin system HicB family antitoxin [Fibrobacterota bacterium]
MNKPNKVHGRAHLRLRILIEQDEDGVYVAECPSLPGCISQGKTRAQALVNIKDAMEGYVESLRKHGDPIPTSISEDVVEISA